MVQQEILVVQVVTEHPAEQVVPVELVVTELTEQPVERVVQVVRAELADRVVLAVVVASHFKLIQSPVLSLS